MDVYRQVYEQLDALPKEERIALLAEILPPQELFARTDGMRCVIRAFGLRAFDISALLVEAGIPSDDPRAAVFRELRGGLIDRKIPNSLRAIASREATVCRRAGAVQVWENGRRAWWVPLAATAAFEKAVGKLIQTFADTRDLLLLEPYPSIRRQARARWIEAADAAYLNLARLSSVNGLGRDEFLSRLVGAFDRRFPTEADICEKIRMELVPVERPLPERVSRILQDVRDAERERQEAEAEAAREQKRLLALERTLREEELHKLEHERQVRERILRQAIDPQVKQAQEIVAQIQSALLRVAREITTALSTGEAISPATRRSWNQRLEALSALSPGSLPLETALEDLRRLAKHPAASNSADTEGASQSVGKALRDLERRASIEMRADLIWQLMQEGKAEAALRRVASLRDRLSHHLSEVDALWEMVVEVGSRNQVLEEERAAEAA